MRTIQTWENPNPDELLETWYGLSSADRRKAIWLMSRVIPSNMDVLTRQGIPRTILGKPIRYVTQKGISLCIRDMTDRPLRATPKSRRAA